MLSDNKMHNIYIYGTGGNGIKVAQLLLTNGYSIQGFVDKRANEIKKLNDIPVITAKDIRKNISDENIIIVITIKNVYSHNDIVIELKKVGINYIIYKPNNILRGLGNDTERAINEIYETLVEKKIMCDFFQVPQTDKIEYDFRERLLIESDERYVKAWCPIELIFNYKGSHDYPGLNMPLFFPLVEFYKYLLSDKKVDNSAIDNFIIYCCEWLKNNKKELTQSQRESFIESKVSVFNEMQKMCEVDIDFFINNCPEVALENGRFYLSSSGRNRVSFLIAKGYKYVPVKMSKTDYEKWCNHSWVNTIKGKIESGDIKSFFAPLPNPFLVDYSVDFVDYQRLFLIPVANKIIKELYIESLHKEDTLTCCDYEKVEIKKSKLFVDCYINDMGIAQAYFESIDLRQESPEIIDRYLITDGEYLKKIGSSMGNYIEIYVLQPVDENKNINCKKEHVEVIFETIINNKQYNGLRLY